jgi:serine/threonine protein kinase
MEEGYAGVILSERYLIEREIGRGGIGIVYLARDQQLHDKPVVIKLLLEKPDDPERDWFRRKFRQEIEALARLDHPGIVGVLGAGETQDGKPFMVMQFVEGVSLRSVMKPEGMDLGRASQLIRQIGQALSAAHDKGICHRDLKPENIMVQTLAGGGKQVKLIDFGIATVQDSKEAANQTSTKVAGTVTYMAPEQLMGKPAPSSDIYAFGVIAYEMIVGRRPFTPDSPYELLGMQQNGVKVKPRELRPAVSEESQAALLKALAFDPALRYARAREFGDELAAALVGQTPVSAPVSAERPGLTNATLKIAADSMQVSKLGRLPERSGESSGIEIANVLFTDIVGYSKLTMDKQTGYLDRLQQIVRNTSEFARASANDQLVRLPTGDGMALVFFGDPVLPIQCAIEIGRELKSYPDIHLRMGIHSGPVYRIADINANKNVAGGGINIAQRVMDCGDGGHILLSKTIADMASQIGDWSQHMTDLGECEVKHGVKVHLYNLCTAEAGNPEIPMKVTAVREKLLAPALPVAVADSATQQRRFVLVGLLIAVLLGGGLGVYRFLNREPSLGPIRTTEFADKFDNKQAWTEPPEGWSIDPGHGLLIVEKQPLPGLATGVNLADFQLSFHLKLLNAGGAAWVLRARNAKNYYLFYLSGPEGMYKGSFLTYVVRDNKFEPTVFVQNISIASKTALKADDEYDIVVKVTTDDAKGGHTNFDTVMTSSETGEVIPLGTFTDQKDTFKSGSIGFRTVSQEKFAVGALFAEPPEALAKQHEQDQEREKREQQQEKQQ